MKATEAMILNFEEIRRRSMILWRSIPAGACHWRPDARAMSCLEMVRHVLEGEHLFHQIIVNRGNLGDYPSPWQEKPYSTLEDELAFCVPYRTRFLDAIRRFTDSDLECIEINRLEKKQKRRLGDYLNRIAYHEAVHAGQMLSYLRTLQLERPLIWD